MASPIRVLIAKDASGIPRVLRTNSAFVKRDIEEIGTTDADELGLVNTKKVGCGVYLWEGSVEVRRFGPEGDDNGPEYIGKLRPVHIEMESEMTGLFAMEPPADEDEDRETTLDNL